MDIREVPMKGGKKKTSGAPSSEEGRRVSGTEEQVLEGVAVAPGIAIGPVYVYARDAVTVEQRRLKDDEVEEEIKRFEWAVSKSERDLNKIISVTQEKLGEESADIFKAQLLMLRDEALYEAVLAHIREDQCNAGYAVELVMTQHRRRMEASDSEYLRERSNDLLDVQERIITHLRRGKLLSSIDPESIVVAENLTAADIILFSRRDILGCALDFGGATSHVSIMARALGVPAVVSLHGITEAVNTGDLMILDGVRGRIIVNPEEETLTEYRTRRERYQRLMQEQKQLAPLAAETIDEHRVRLLANLEFVEELDLLEEYGAEGIGLLRSEVLFLMKGRLSFTEEEQYETYKQIVEAVRPGTTTARVLDLGGDKMLPVAHREHNPFLGWRGIRVLLDKPELFKPQLRALLRASAHGPLRLLIPMITNMAELRRVQDVLDDVKDELREQGYAFDEAIPFGIMVEVPAVALMAEQFAREVDFFSIGSNDLTQYLLAVDRGNDLVADRYQELHPAVLSVIKQVADAAHKQGIPVSLCGEMAANPRATPILVGLGLDEMSASPTYLPEVKRVIRAMQFPEAEELAQRALALQNADEVVALVDEWLEEHACGPVYFVEHDHDPPVRKPYHTPTLERITKTTEKPLVESDDPQ